MVASDETKQDFDIWMKEVEGYCSLLHVTSDYFSSHFREVCYSFGDDFLGGMTPQESITSAIDVTNTMWMDSVENFIPLRLFNKAVFARQ